MKYVGYLFLFVFNMFIYAFCAAIITEVTGEQLIPPALEQWVIIIGAALTVKVQIDSRAKSLAKANLANK